MRWEGHVASREETRNAYIILVGRPDGKQPIGYLDIYERIIG
jgi:hypothetical protein